MRAVDYDKSAAAPEVYGSFVDLRLTRDLHSFQPMRERRRAGRIQKCLARLRAAGVRPTRPMQKHQLGSMSSSNEGSFWIWWHLLVDRHISNVRLPLHNRRLASSKIGAWVH